MAPSRELNKRAICLIADHLDRILAAGEDLVGQCYCAHDADSAGHHATVNAFVTRCHAIELCAIAAIVRAHEHAATLARSRTRFATLAGLFASATVAIQDTVELTVPPEERAFSGSDPIEFLQTRGLIADDCGCLRTVEKVVVGEDFLIAGCIHLASLMDMTAAFLDAIEVHFELFPELDDIADPKVSAMAPSESALPTT